MNFKNENQSLEYLLKSILEISIKAGEIILDIYKSDFSNSIRHKSDNSPVTIADKKANEFIVGELARISPEIPVIAEESKQIDFSRRKNFDYFWLVDPLDGTKEFIKKNGDFTVNIALIKEKEPIMGAVYVPVEQKLYWALKGHNAFVKTGQNIEIIHTSMLSKENIRILLSRSHLDEKTLIHLKKFDNPIIDYRGSALKFLLIAEGKADLYFRYTPTMEWDTAASHIILKEAGGNIFDINTNKELVYNKESLINPGFIAKPYFKKQ